MSKARSIVGLIVAIYLLLVLLDRYVLVELLVRRTLSPAVLAGCVALAAIGCGFTARVLRGRVWWVAEECERLDTPRDFLLGYPLFGALCFLVGALRVSVATMCVPLFIFGALGALALIGRVRATLTAPAAETPRDSALGIAAIFIAFACAFVLAQAPASSIDELAYHLAVPQAWVVEGRAVELPLLSHSYFPLGIESADLPLLASLGAIDGSIASHYLHFLAAIATAVLIQRRTKSALITAAIVSTPALAITAGWSLVDWPLLGICVALFVGLEDDDAATIAVATGAGLLTKYTFIPFALIAIVLAKKWRAALPGLAIGSVFFIRNLILTGNPFAPFLGADAPHVSGYRATFLSDYIFEGHFVDEALGAALLALLVFTTGRVALALLAAGVVLFFLAPSSRILIPFLAIPAMTAAPALSRRTLRVLVSIAIAVQLSLVVWYVEGNGAFSLLSARAIDTEHLAKQRASYAASTWIDASLPPRSRTLIIGLHESLWFTRPVRAGGNFDGERMSRYLDVATPEALYERLKKDGITHIAVFSTPPPTNVAQKRAERETRLTPESQRMLAQLLNRYAASVGGRADATLFTLR